MPNKFLSLTEARKTIAAWQEIFGLRDWTIDVRLARAKTLGDFDVMGDCDLGKTKRKAVIRLLDPVDYDEAKASFWEDDHETVIVHELLHMVLPARWTGKSRTDERYLQYEQSIDLLARGLVKLKRGA